MSPFALCLVWTLIATQLWSPLSASQSFLSPRFSGTPFSRSLGFLSTALVIPVFHPLLSLFTSIPKSSGSVHSYLKLIPLCRLNHSYPWLLSNSHAISIPLPECSHRADVIAPSRSFHLYISPWHQQAPVWTGLLLETWPPPLDCWIQHLQHLTPLVPAFALMHEADHFFITLLLHTSIFSEHRLPWSLAWKYLH